MFTPGISGQPLLGAGYQGHPLPQAPLNFNIPRDYVPASGAPVMMDQAMLAQLLAAVAASRPAAAPADEVLTYSDGSRYVGQIKEGLPHGKGKLIYAPNAESYKSYEGDFVQGRREGTGKAIWTTGKQYQGEWENDKRSGDGFLISPEGDTYRGQWADDKMCGRGVYKYVNGEQYEGQMRNSVKEGQGKYTWPDGQVYSGAFVNDCIEGEGTLTIDHECFKQGIFKDGVLSQGKYYFGEGWKEGTFHNGDLWNGVYVFGKGLYRRYYVNGSSGEGLNGCCVLL